MTAGGSCAPLNLSVVLPQPPRRIDCIAVVGVEASVNNVAVVHLLLTINSQLFFLTYSQTLTIFSFNREWTSLGIRIRSEGWLCLLFLPKIHQKQFEIFIAMLTLAILFDGEWTSLGIRIMSMASLEDSQDSPKNNLRFS